MTIDFYIYAAGLALICFYAAAKLRYELQMLQQNSYRIDRYWRWQKQQKPAGELPVGFVTTLLSAGILGGFAFGRWWAYAIAAVGLISLQKGVKLLTTKYKKPLVFTARAVRLYLVALAIVAAVVAPLAILGFWWWSAMAAFFLAVGAPFVMIAAVWLLSPVERAINSRYVNDARRILAEMPGLVVIGITGSYGKTSTKHYLHRILSERFSVVMTPGSFNTTLGVVRTIREHLKPYTEVFIVEMGAKQRGDIAEICELVRPQIGIITAVGEQHLESFGSIENVQRTKFELVDALPADGVAILNDDFEYIANRPVGNVAQVLRYTSGARKADYRVTDVKYGRGETTFAIESAGSGNGHGHGHGLGLGLGNGHDNNHGHDHGETKGVSEPFSTRLVGIHNLSNILAGYLAGRALGMTEGEMRHAIASIEQVEHRLNIRHTPGGVTIIDDAFNSNPHGAAMALDVLAGFGSGGGGANEGATKTGGANGSGRRIVVTPGMIELGEKQEYYNRELGRQMAAACDIAVVVGEYNREAILAGLSSEGFDPAGIYTARDFADASRHVREIVRAGDTVLYENDLPDTFK